MTLSYNDLISQPDPTFTGPYDQGALRARLVEAVTEAVPGLTIEAEDFGWSLLNAIAEDEVAFGELTNAQLRRSLLARATGRDLDVVATRYRVVRRAGETDESVRRRCVETPVGFSAGTKTSIELNARAALTAVIDSQAVVNETTRNVTLYALKANQEALTAGEEADVLRYVTADDRVIMGVQITLAAATVTGYTITLAALYERAVIDEVTLAARIRTAIYEWLGTRGLLGQPVYLSDIIAVAKVPGAVDITVSAPAATLPSREGTVYVCPQTPEAVQVTATPVGG